MKAIAWKVLCGLVMSLGAVALFVLLFPWLAIALIARANGF